MIVPALSDAIGGGILVTISSRCVAGRVRRRYGYEGGIHLMQIGTVLAGDLSGAKARLLQMVALSIAADRITARELIARMMSRVIDLRAVRVGG